MRVIGLDLSICATGVAWPDGTVSTVKTKAAGDFRLPEIREALFAGFGGLDLAIIEDLPKHAGAAGITGMVHGVVRAALMDCGIPYALVVPSSLKKYATGSGNADKVKMGVAAHKRFGLEFADDNQCDAWWLRAMGLDTAGTPLVGLPQVQRDSLAKMRWPVGPMRSAA